MNFGKYKSTQVFYATYNMPVGSEEYIDKAPIWCSVDLEMEPRHL